MNQGSITITDTATKILSADMNRRSFWVMNTGLKKIFLGYSSAVTTANPYLSPTGSFDRELARDYRGDIYGICATGETSTISYIDF
jgi:hypothetical protein